LCKELGYPHPDYLLEQLTGEQLAEWRAYDQLEPIGVDRIEYGFAMLASVIMNIAISIFGKRNTKQFLPTDFLPDWDGTRKVEPKKKQSVEEMKQILQAIAGMQKGSKKEKGGGKK
jgi:hypothetical protein